MRRIERLVVMAAFALLAGLAAWQGWWLFGVYVRDVSRWVW